RLSHDEAGFACAQLIEDDGGEVRAIIAIRVLAGSLAQLCSGRLERTLGFVRTQSPRRHTQLHAISRRQVGEREWRDFFFDGANALRERGFSVSCLPERARTLHR